MKRLKHIVNSVIWIFAGLYLLLVILLHIPAVKTCIGNTASNALAQKLGTKVEIQEINLGFLNRIILDGITIYDQQQQKLLTSSRASIKVNLLSLLQGKVSISSAQLFGATANTYRQTAQSKPNYQFVLDSLASKEPQKESKLDVTIGSLIIRNGTLIYHQNDAPKTIGQLNLKHLHITNLSAHILINTLTNDSLNLQIKRLALDEASGVHLNALTTKLQANKRDAHLNYLNIDMPGTCIRIKDGSAHYQFENKQLALSTLTYNLTFSPSYIRPCDFAFLLPALRPFVKKIDLSTKISGTISSLRMHDLHLSGSNIYFSANGEISNWQNDLQWKGHINTLNLHANGIQFIVDNLGQQFHIPIEITRLGNIYFKGDCSGRRKDIALKGKLHTDAGNATLAVNLQNNHFKGNIETAGIALGRIIDNAQFGNFKAKLNAEGYWLNNVLSMKAKGAIDLFDYNQYTYHNISLNAAIKKKNRQIDFNGKFDMDDPNGEIHLNGSLSNMGKLFNAKLQANVAHFNPKSLRLSTQIPAAFFGMQIEANIKGHNLNTALGSIRIKDFDMQAPDKHYHLNTLSLQADTTKGIHTICLDSDFGQMRLKGNYDYATLSNSITNIIATKLPTLPGLPRYKKIKTNDFSFEAEIQKSDWLQQVLNIDLDLQRPLRLNMMVNDRHHLMDIFAQMPSFTYAGQHFERGYLHIATVQDTLKANIHTKKIDENGQGIYLHVQANASDNKLNSTLTWKNLKGKSIWGTLRSETTFFTHQKLATAHICIHPSNIWIDNTAWEVQPSDIIYQAKHLTIDHFAVVHDDQHIVISGEATPHSNDSITAELKNIDVDYILNLVNFHAVDFSGKATGHAHISNVFAKPQAAGTFKISDFKFQDGRMGTLTANATWNEKAEQIDIDAIAHDTLIQGNHPTPILAQTNIQGYVSPTKSYIDLNIAANNTRIEFLKSFCDSFIDHVEGYASGDIKVAGPLSNINLSGDAIANGKVHLSALNTEYTLRDAHVHAIPDEIYLMNDTLYDKDGHHGVLYGVLHHQHLTQMSYDCTIEAHNLLAYDTHEFGNNTFYGTAYATGRCDIKGKPGNVDINIDARPNQGTQIVYNVASPTTITDQNFIHWSDRGQKSLPTVQDKSQEDTDEEPDIPSDMHINFLVNMTPEATIKLLMDKATDDHIILHGSGGIRATYYNKGGFDMYGNYLVDNGMYKLTIQNAIKRDFTFMPGGTISFGGDPYHAALNLKAQYTVQGVSLSDLNIGRSFANNNIRVNCLMNITGTPAAPKLDFNLDLPTLNSDAKQMVLSLINSEEEMNQQVLYLLAIGRFYTQASNNAATETSQSKTSLAMQSILSGTVSQQINNVLSSVINNTNWNFGANISTGDEGWNNAEYEGILSGRLLNNRLLFNGQFGYRDNANATTSFIGDFDLRYLLFPNGNFAIRMYNQTNDRYFTRNSLNTQGIGFILKKDFNGIGELFRKNKHRIEIKKVK
ncbi:MAG: translocation/assembly module TamB domain-containing protein [Prevotella sp.]|nr:translocation/assembly module TamB domain-containing protein [Prevotella sp.]